MLLTVFEKNYFLLALGWGIINSIWQAGSLWLIYKLVSVSAKNNAAIFKYHLSLLLLVICFTWFTITTVQGYLLLDGSGFTPFVNVNLQWILFYQKFSTAFQLISCVYLLFLFLNGIKFFHHVNRILLLKKSQFIKAPADIRIFVNQTAAHLGIKKKVKVLISKNAEVPCITGFFKPLILLPVTALNNLTTSQAEAVILHELAHIKRNDYLVNLFQSLIELVLFFNPFVILLGKAVRKERENCCDDWVINYRYNRHDYATALVLLEQRRQLPIQLAVAATSGKKQLLTRVKRLFTVDPSININIWQKVKLTGLACVALTFLTIFLPGIDSQTAVNKTAKLPAKILNSSKNVAAINGEVVQLRKIISNTTIPLALAAEISKPKLRKLVNKEAKQQIEFSDALINEELLTVNNKLQNLATLVGEKEELPAKEYLVKIEEETSGSKGKKSYLLQFKNNNGQLEIKPLIILNKSKTIAVKAKKSTVTKQPVVKKKITS